jgi:hypothetical protein
MSRTRIVKGKIYEKIGGDLKYYSEADITEIASETYAEQSTKGISHVGNPGKPLPPSTQAKCVIHFRTDQNYKNAPAFGFDWIRIADTGYAGDVWYLNYVGKYRDPGDNTKLKQVYYNGVFLKSAQEFNKITGTFERLVLEAQKNAGNSDHVYYVPKMTLRKDKTADLILKIKIDEAPKELKLDYDKSVFEISDFQNDEITNKSKGNRTIPIKIKCKNIFNIQKSITILADKQVCGKLNILPNNFSYNLKVVFVTVTTKINGAVQTGTVANAEKIKLKQVLAQSYIESNVEEDTLDLSGFFASSWFNWWYTQNGQVKTHELHKYLNEKIHSKNDKYRDYFKIYVFGSSSGGLNGIAEDVGHVKSAIVFPGRLTSDPSLGSSVHEMLHAIGLYHTFDNDSAFTFERAVLDNVMDYSHWNHINRISTTHWQWRLLQSRLGSYKTVAR